MFAGCAITSFGVATAAGLATTATTQAPPQAPANQNSGKPGVSNSGNVNVQILMNTLNALSKPQPQANDDTPSYQAPAPRPAQQPYPTPAQQKPVLVTNAGYNCEDSLRASLAASYPQSSQADIARIARGFWENDYRDISIGNVPALRKHLSKLNAQLANPALADSRAGDQCLAGAITARLDELGWSPEAIDRTHKTKFDEITARSSTERDSGNGRKRLVLKQNPGCLKVVDIKRDSTVKNMYWYAIANTCGEVVQAHWCEGKGCHPTDRAAEIGAGDKEESWMQAQTPSDVRFRGTACATAYRGHSVQYDKTRNECWVWAE
ncbi:hypothetical protein AL486_15385 [Pandoraea apista]|nr:hypothetical protein AL486_15385 [Pandoraea apista]